MQPVETYFRRKKRIGIERTFWLSLGHDLGLSDLGETDLTSRRVDSLSFGNPIPQEDYLFLASDKLSGSVIHLSPTALQNGGEPTTINYHASFTNPQFISAKDVAKCLSNLNSGARRFAQTISPGPSRLAYPVDVLTLPEAREFYEVMIKLAREKNRR